MRKYLISFLLLILYSYGVFSQSFCGFTCSDCLKKDFVSSSEIITLSNVSYAAPGISADFRDYQISKGSCPLDSACISGNAAAVNSLTYNVYYPDLSCDNYPQLPAIILFHGGGFGECADKANMKDYCKDFAQRGFVAFSVEYRRGKESDDTALTASYMLALYRGLQDARGAIKTIIKKQTDGTEPYQIDVNKIFIGGESEGGVIAVNTAYLDEVETEQVLPGVSDILGPLDNLPPMSQYYFGEPTITFTIRGVFNLWGGLAEADMNGAAINFIDPDEPPFIGFHGEQDLIVPYDLQSTTYITGGKATVSQCNNISYTIPSPGNAVWFAGSRAIYENCISQNICAEVYLDSDMNHGFNGNPDPFGQAFTKKSKVKNYIVARATSFFQAVLCDRCDDIGQSLFRDCVNSRCKASTQSHMNDNHNCDVLRLTVDSNKNPSWKLIRSINTFEIIFSERSQARMELLNIKGQMIIYKSGNYDHISVDVSDLTAGIYILKVSTPAESFSERFVIIP